MSKHIPNTITALNLICGVLSIFFIIRGEVIWASYMIFLAAIFDFFDGFAARLLNAYSDIGKELDSLADLISFGLAPSFIVMYEIADAMGLKMQFSMHGISPFHLILLFLPILLVVATAFRLARFNNDPSQEETFLGLPSPASGLFFASLPLVRNYLEEFSSTNFLNNPAFIAALALIFSYLLISNVPMFSLKIKNIRAKKNIPSYILGIISLALLLLFSLKAVFAIVILYIFMSLILVLIPQNTEKEK
ncbi:MAG: CDP-diacylglycerol--serine O-phosphatidyltransferase [Bacteroidota bacterium]|nr:CDP-diacylglycerol--serine O-phosphatidyltransferase [Bacteroidota bacterium]